jgi:addiction module RelB/DinJ family antitoxin
LEVRWLISVNVNADDLNLPAEIARRLKGKRVAISEIGDGFLLKPISEDPISEARGMFKGKGFTVDDYSRSKQMEKLVEDDLKDEAIKIFTAFGLSMSDAIDLFLKQTVLTQALPFAVDAPNAATKQVMQDVRDCKNLNYSEPGKSIFDGLHGDNKDASKSRRIKEMFPGITIDPDIRGGKPVLSGRGRSRSSKSETGAATTPRTWWSGCGN